MRWFSLFAVLFCGAIAPEIALAQTKPAEPEQTIVSNKLWLRFVVPKSWTMGEMPPIPGEKDPDQSIFFENVDGASSMAMIRFGKQLSDDEAAKRIQAAAEEMRAMAKANGSKVIKDEEYSVAGGKGWIRESELPIGDQMFRALTVCFILDKHEYRFNCSGDKPAYDRFKPAVERLIATIEIVSSEK